MKIALRSFISIIFFSALVVVLLVPTFGFAAGEGLVPCDGSAALPCNFCQLLELFTRIIRFIAWDLAPAAFVILTVYAGVLYLTYATNEGNLKKAKSVFGTALWGFLAILFAWFIIDLIVQKLGSNKYVFLKQFQCVEFSQKLPGPGTSSPTTQTGRAATPGKMMTDLEIQATMNRLQNECPKCEAIIAKNATQSGLPADLIKAVILGESGGDPNARSGAGAVGLMQVLPSTALDMGLGSSENLADPETNIRIGTKYLKQLYDDVGLYQLKGTADRYELAIAAYNGGKYNPGLKKAALENSADCPGYYAYQCRINPGGLNETYYYTLNINKIRQEI